MSRNVKLVRALSAANVVFGVMSVIVGIVSINAAPFHDGVFGMGIWIGAWILITGLTGYFSTRRPNNYCRVGVFLGCCLVAMVTVAICSIVLGTVVISHYKFEMTVTREYYKDRGSWGTREHEDYWKPQEYFDERHRQGAIGCVVYGSLLAIIIMDFLVCCGCCYACRDMCTSEQAHHRNVQRRTSRTQRQQQQQQRQEQEQAERQHQQQQWNDVMYVTSPHIIPTFAFTPEPGQLYEPYKLPTYAELYPEVYQGVATNPNPVDPPAYSPLAEPRDAPTNAAPRVMVPTARVTTNTSRIIERTSERGPQSRGSQSTEAGTVLSVEQPSTTPLPSTNEQL